MFRRLWGNTAEMPKWNHFCQRQEGGDRSNRFADAMGEGWHDPGVITVEEKTKARQTETRSG